MTKQLTLAAVFAATLALPATAGGMAEPIMEAPVIMADTTPTGTSGLTMWFILAAVITFAAAN